MCSTPREIHFCTLQNTNIFRLRRALHLGISTFVPFKTPHIFVCGGLYPLCTPKISFFPPAAGLSPVRFQLKIRLRTLSPVRFWLKTGSVPCPLSVFCLKTCPYPCPVPLNFLLYPLSCTPKMSKFPPCGGPVPSFSIRKSYFVP